MDDGPWTVKPDKAGIDLEVTASRMTAIILMTDRDGDECVRG